MGFINRTAWRIVKILVSLSVGGLLLKASQDVYHSVLQIETSGIRSAVNWDFAFVGIVFLLLLLFVGAMVVIWLPEKAGSAQKLVIAWRARLDWLRWFLAIIVAAIPAYFFLYSPLAEEFTGSYMRLLALLISTALIAAITSPGETLLIQRQNLLFGLILTGSLFYIASQFAIVTGYPFALSWSEGNRLYDYSVMLGADRYNFPGQLTIPYRAPGRYLLWGFLFAIPDTPIWLHRLWNAILATVPYALFGYLIARWSKLDTMGKWMLVLWTLLFLSQGPIYTPLIISAIIITIMVRQKRLFISLAGVALAGYYAASSRWSWLPAAPTWAAFIWLADFEFDKQKNWVKSILKLSPIALIAVLGIVVGIPASPMLSSPEELVTSVSFTQPLLWYRLLPNATYSTGILLGLVLAAGPLVVLLIWMAFSKRWCLNWLQGLAYVGSCAAFLAIGLVASVKIGGGNNLHNLDMLFVTLIFITGFMLRDRSSLHLSRWPIIVQGIFFLVIFLPTWNAASNGIPLQTPPQNEVDEALHVIDKRAQQALNHGDVLFMDQRQLLTFGYLEDVPLVSDYEKKFLMDQAMAGNIEYFKDFYADLADKRFSLIITDPLFTSEKGQEMTFGEENDAWVTWVAEPILCYYTPIRILPSVNVELLAPRDSPKNCPDWAILEQN